MVAFVKPMEVGSRFKDWPLHITIVPWFRTDISSEELVSELVSKLADIKPFEARVGKETHFGGWRKLVNLIMQPSPLAQIERIVRTTLKSHDAWLVDESTKKQRPYRPHITAQLEGRVYEGDRIAIGKLYIVMQKGDYKIIESEIRV